MSSHHPESQEHQSRHPTFKQYVVIATILFAITIVEFLIIVPEELQGSSVVVAPLILLSAIKFAIVIMFYMHLKFDSRLYTGMFIGGLLLGLAVVMALLGLFSSFQPTPREFAEANAVPFEHQTGSEEHGPTPPEGQQQPPPPPQGSPEPQEPPPGEPPAQGSPEPGGTGDLVAQGQAIFIGTGGCGACHTIEGLTSGMVGPDLTHIGTVAADRKPGMPAEEYIRESIENPAAFVVEGFPPAMPSNIRNTMSDSEFQALVEFLLAQK